LDLFIHVWDKFGLYKVRHAIIIIEVFLEFIETQDISVFKLAIILELTLNGIVCEVNLRLQDGFLVQSVD